MTICLVFIIPIITIIFGKNPVNGGIPASDSRRIIKIIGSIEFIFILLNIFMIVLILIIIIAVKIGIAVKQYILKYAIQYIILFAAIIEIIHPK